MKIDWQWDVMDPGLESIMEKAAQAALDAEGIAVPCGVFIRVTDDEGIQEVNREYRQLDKPTDVLSFPALAFKPGHTLKDEQRKLKTAYDVDWGCGLLGDMIVSLERVLAQAQEYGHSVQREMAYMVVHSMCHLMGYDHMVESDKEKMRAKEELALSAIGAGRGNE